MRLTREKRIEYNKKMNAKRVKKRRANNKEHALEYKRKYKKDFINKHETKKI